MGKPSVSILTLVVPVAVLATAVAAQWLSAGAMQGGEGPMSFLQFNPFHRSDPVPEASLIPDQRFEPLDPAQAQLKNAQIPFSKSPLLVGARYSWSALTGETQAQALNCMTLSVYYEAGLEPLAGKQAVAQVVINRWAIPIFPKTICGVVQQGAGKATGCQFTFICDGSLARKPNPLLWASAEAVARAALDGFVYDPIGASTHYHADYVVPYWAPTMFKLVQIGRHIFYRWPGAQIPFSTTSLASPAPDQDRPAAADAAAQVSSETAPPPAETSPAEPVAAPEAQPANDGVRQALTLTPATPAAAPPSQQTLPGPLQDLPAPPPPARPTHKAVPEPSLRGG